MPSIYRRSERLSLGTQGASGKFSNMTRQASCGSRKGTVLKAVAMHMGLNPGGSWIVVISDTASLFLFGVETPPERRFGKKYRQTAPACQPGTTAFHGNVKVNYKIVKITNNKSQITNK